MRMTGPVLMTATTTDDTTGIIGGPALLAVPGVVVMGMGTGMGTRAGMMAVVAIFTGGRGRRGGGVLMMMIVVLRMTTLSTCVVFTTFGFGFGFGSGFGRLGFGFGGVWTTVLARKTVECPVFEV